MKHTLVPLVLTLTLIGCSSWSSRLRYGTRTDTGTVTGIGAGHVCIYDLDGRYRRLQVSDRKATDLAKAQLIGRQVAFYGQDGLVANWSREGRPLGLRRVPAVDLDTCQPVTATRSAERAPAAGERAWNDFLPLLLRGVRCILDDRAPARAPAEAGGEWLSLRSPASATPLLERCPPATEVCTLLGAALKDMAATAAGPNHHQEIGLAVDLLCKENGP